MTLKHTLSDTQVLFLRAFAKGPISAEEKGITWTSLINRGLVKMQGSQIVLTDAGRRFVALHGFDI